jgi:hypothetical protein
MSAEPGNPENPLRRHTSLYARQRASSGIEEALRLGLCRGNGTESILTFKN